MSDSDELGGAVGFAVGLVVGLNDGLSDGDLDGLEVDDVTGESDGLKVNEPAEGDVEGT